MHSFTPAYLERLTFSTEEVAALAALAALAEAQGRHQLYIHQQPEVLESLRQAAVIESIESSNRLEGITAPRERIEALVLRPTEPRDRSEQEIAGYRDALALSHELVRLVLRQVRDEGAIVLQGRGRGATWTRVGGR